MVDCKDYLLEIARILGPTTGSITEEVILTFLGLSAVSLLDFEEGERDRLFELLFSPLAAAPAALGNSNFDTTCGAVKFAGVLARLKDELRHKHSEKDALSLAYTMIGLYEQLLDLKLIDNGDGCSIETVAFGRRQKGCYYTPEQLTRATTAAALNRLVSYKKAAAGEQLSAANILAWKIADPAMGAGAFLVSALDYLLQFAQSELKPESDLQRQSQTGYAQNISGGGPKRDSDLVWLLAENCLYGVDVDPLAREAARITLWLYCAKKTGRLKPLAGFLHQHLKSGDSLVSGWSHRLGAGNDSQSDFDIWTARFFWPTDCGLSWAEARADQAADLEIVSRLARRYRFFHWELEFPDVFAGEDPGFDAVVANPPWEITKPNAREFFSSADWPDKAVGKSESALAEEEISSQDVALQAAWGRVNDQYRALAGYFRESGLAPAGEANFGRHVLYRAQGVSDLNAYKLFLELGFALLKREGCLAMLVPSGIYTDKGAAPLRRLLMEQADLYELRSFVNRDRAFAIHSSFNFCLLALQRGKQSDHLAVSFSNTNGATLKEVDMPSIAYSKKDVQIFSPKWRALVEVEHAKDLDVLRKLYAGGVPLGSTEGQAAWQVSFRREFDLTNDSPSFIRRVEAEGRGYVGDEFGNWLKGNWQNHQWSASAPEPGLIASFDRRQSIRIENIADLLLPLYEGRMLGQFDCNQKQYVSGRGRTAVWKNAGSAQSNNTAANAIKLAPQYLLPLSKAQGSCDLVNLKTGYLAVGSATNARTMIAAALNAVPCGNSVPVFLGQSDPTYSLGLLACLNSFVFDYVLRLKMSGNNINYYLLEECPLPSCAEVLALDALIQSSALLSLGHVRFAPQLLALSGKLNLPVSIELKPEDRVRSRCLIEALVAYLFQLEYEEYAWILRHCQEELKAGRKNAQSPGPDSLPNLPLKGFWRVDKNEPAASRLPALCLKTYADLLQHGLPEFLIRMTRLSSHALEHPTSESASSSHGHRSEALGRESLSVLSSNLQALLQVPLDRARQAAI